MSEVVVVTGASAGVGRAVAREFAKHGASVALVARSLLEINFDFNQLCVDAENGSADRLKKHTPLPAQTWSRAMLTTAAISGGG